MAYNMRMGLATASMAVSILVAVLHASSTTTPIATSVSDFTSWLPITVLAVIASVVIALLYYIVGIVINNKTVISAAFSEFENVLGTVVIVVIIIALLSLFGSGIFQSLLMPKSSAQGLCSTLQGANLNFISSSQQSPTNDICTGIIQNSGSAGGNPQADQLTDNLDYGLASTYLLMANLTNQTSTNLNAYFMFRGYINFLNTFNASDIMCEPGFTCQTFGFGAFSVKYVFNPFAGYELALVATNFLTQQSTLIFYLFIIQLMAILALMYAWPFMLAAGIILRASFLTRRVGGLLIAMAIVGLIVYPSITLIQYNALNSISSGISPASPIFGVAPIGPESFNTMQLIGDEPPVTSLSSTLAQMVLQAHPTVATFNYDSSLNFYVFPRADYIMYHDGCWPLGGHLWLAELQVTSAYSIPGVALANGILNIISSASTVLGGQPIQSQLLRLGFTCNSNNLMNTIFNLYNLYGMMSVIGLIIPLIDVLIVIAALFSVSSLLGGDTRLFGLERLV
ncbi:MAG: hypothetical protein M1321_00455 [Candidatus Marsarchaeota archaeon]|nr:hypothetical protein [Candidatus Marsarchaeota archaeon]